MHLADTFILVHYLSLVFTKFHQNSMLAFDYIFILWLPFQKNVTLVLKSQNNEKYERGCLVHISATNMENCLFLTLVRNGWIWSQRFSFGARERSTMMTIGTYTMHNGRVCIQPSFHLD